jgi:GNAT superfamily N-acetyltransferase
MLVRAVREEDLPRLQAIERAAGALFRTVDMPEIADEAPPTLDELARYQQAGSAWAAVDTTDGPVAYLIAEAVDGGLHIEQVSVDPRYARLGIGRELIEHAAQRARAGHLAALTLTTFRDVPWNAPYYARCGFRTLSADEVTPGLVAIKDREVAHGLDRWPRVCMRRDL